MVTETPFKMKPVKETAINVALISTYPPRECGIATFTRDLLEALQKRGENPWVVALDHSAHGVYGRDVRFRIRQEVPEDYRTAAKMINASPAQVVSLQHEFGIFGGHWGEHVLELTKRINRPLVVTLHTVLPNPPLSALRITQALCRQAAAVVVMSPSAVELLEQRYRVSASSVHLIWHGVPEVEPLPKQEAKLRLGLADRLVLSTFGLIGPNKGIEDAIEAVAWLCRQYPHVLYLVLGKTHPNLERIYGEDYLDGLKAKVRALNLHDHVHFENRYLKDEEILTYLQASDVYLTPYHNPDQIVSGTLSWALASGCAIVSTPYRYARDMLAPGYGVLVPFRQPQKLAHALKKLINRCDLRGRLGQRAYLKSLPMRWPKVAAEYARLFAQVSSQTEVGAA
ncbi:MAG: glycosyltransferase family 4 protein [Methylohalobius sp.]|nr:glycosyltransferase family 4 protein [Methylohalobius sp.]